MKADLLSGAPIDFQQVATHLKGEAELNLLSELSLTEDIDDQILQRIDENLRPMERAYLERRKLEIQRAISEAQRRGMANRLRELAWRRSILRMLNERNNYRPLPITRCPRRTIFDGVVSRFLTVASRSRSDQEGVVPYLRSEERNDDTPAHSESRTGDQF